MAQARSMDVIGEMQITDIETINIYRVGSTTTMIGGLMRDQYK